MGFLNRTAADLATEIATRKPTSAKKGRIHESNRHALVHPEGSPFPRPGSASHREHAGSFAKMFQGSLCKSQTTASSSPSSLAAHAKKRPRMGHR